MALKFFMSFSLLNLGWQATAGAHCREEPWPLNRSLSRRGTAGEGFDLSTSQLGEEFRWELVIGGAELGVL